MPTNYNIFSINHRHIIQTAFEPKWMPKPRNYLLYT
jgi:hypothetical protein